MHRPLYWLGKRVQEINVAHGWYDDARTFGDDIALLHSEVSEAFEAYRKDGIVGNLKGEDEPAPYMKDCVGAEFADVFIRLVDSCHRYEIDLDHEVDKKLDYNLTRSYRHGNKIL